MLEQRDIPDTLTAATAMKWVNCPGSAELESSFDFKPRVYLEDSLWLHELASDCLEFNQTPDDLYAEYKTCREEGEEASILTERQLQALDDYINYVKSLLVDENSQLRVDEKVSYNHIVPGGKGKVDAMVIDEGVCHIIDLSAVRMPVDAKKNHQLLLYALGAIASIRETYHCDLFKLTCVQPLLHRRSSWEITRDELKVWGDTIKNSVKSALSAQPHFSPSLTACSRCQARSRCTPLAVHCMKFIKQHQESLTMYDANKLNPNELSKILNELPLIKLWQESVEQKAIERLKQGYEIPGYALTYTKPTVSWTHDQAAANVMSKLGLTEREIYHDEVVLAAKVKSPEQVKYRLGDKYHLLEKLIKTQQGEPSLISTKAKKQLLVQPDRKAYSDPKLIAA